MKNYEYIDINGAMHFVLHLPCADRNAPLLLYLHGGPGQSECCFASFIENYDKPYNAVYYDQRGTGRTYRKSKATAESLEVLLSDLEQLIIYLLKKYGKEKLILVGHSFGSALGSIFAMKHPEYLLMFIGTGQMIDMQANEKYGFELLYKAAENNPKHIEILDKLGEYPGAEFTEENFKKLQTVRNLQSKYKFAEAIGGKAAKIALSSGVFSIIDFFTMMNAYKVNLPLVNALYTLNLKNYGTKYEIPVVYVLGDRDFQTPWQLASEYLEIISAPKKQLFLVKNAGHLAYMNNLDEYRQNICKAIEMLKD